MIGRGNSRTNIFRFLDEVAEEAIGRDRSGRRAVSGCGVQDDVNSRDFW